MLLDVLEDSFEVEIVPILDAGLTQEVHQVAAAPPRKAAAPVCPTGAAMAGTGCPPVSGSYPPREGCPNPRAVLWVSAGRRCGGAASGRNAYACPRGRNRGRDGPV